MSKLKKLLFEEYNGFSDKRIKKLDKASTFIVDDRTEYDYASDGSLYGPFCAMLANVKSEELVGLRLSGTVAVGAKVEKWIKKYEAKHTTGLHESMTFTVTPGDYEKLEGLADAIDSIVALGAPRYAVPSYKYHCPRTAASLRRLKETLDRMWS